MTDHTTTEYLIEEITWEGRVIRIHPIRRFMNLEKEMAEMDIERGTMEFQAAYIIYDKYKRTQVLDLNDLHRRSKSIAIARRQKKEPNLDYLTQALSEYVKTINS